MPRTRRGRGEGSIYYRPDRGGTWEAQVSLGYDQKGQRIRKTIFGRSKKQVQDKLAALQNDATTGHVTSTQMKMEQYLKHWLETRSSQLRQTTKSRYEEIMRLHINPFIGSNKLAKITPSQIQLFYAMLKEQQRGTRIIQMTHMILSAAFKQACRWGYIRSNPCSLVAKPKHQYKQTEVWSAEQCSIFFEAAKADRYYPLYVLAVTTGARLGELLGLYWKDIDLQKATIHIRRTLVELSKNFIIGEPKTTRSKRPISLTHFAIEVLREHRKKMFAEGHAGPKVFCSEKGEWVFRSNLRKHSFNKIIKQAALTKIRFHDLRHTAATLLLKEGTHPSIVAAQLGHASTKTTLDIYSHVLPEMTHQAANNMDAAFKRLAGIRQVNDENDATSK